MQRTDGEMARERRLLARRYGGLPKAENLVRSDDPAGACDESAAARARRESTVQHQRTMGIAVTRLQGDACPRDRARNSEERRMR